MHYKVKQKLSTATKLYLVVPEGEKAIQLKIQLPSAEYVQINLHQPLPSRVDYISLANGGFNFNAEVDTPIIRYSAIQTKKVLKDSIGYRNNNQDTIEKLIEIIDTMKEYI